MSRSDSAKLHVSISRAVVGVDGSPESLAALEWLAGVIEADGTIVAVGVGNDADRTRLEHEWTKGRAGRATVQCRATEGEPAEVLLAVADEVDADLVVVGVHPKLRLAPRTIGHVTADLIRNADRPVVVVDGPQRADVPGATIVVDTASGKATDAAVRWAAGFADAHGSALELVHSRPNQPIFSPDGLLDALALYIDPDVLGSGRSRS
ncbi:MAG: universal stress protein [Acidimicrobiales bacterium]